MDFLDVEVKAAAMTEAAMLDRVSCELKTEAGVDRRRREIYGYASTFDITPDSHGDIVLPGAFDASLRERKAAEFPVFWRHDTSQIPIGRPLSIVADSKGLHTVTRLFRTARADELLAACEDWLSAGAAPGMSIGFQTQQVDWRKINGRSTRALAKVRLIEYSFTEPLGQANRGAVVLSTKTAATFEPRRTPAEWQAELDEAAAWLATLQRDEQHEALQRTLRLQEELDEASVWADKNLPGYQQARVERETHKMVARIKREAYLTVLEREDAERAADQRRRFDMWLAAGAYGPIPR